LSTTEPFFSFAVLSGVAACTAYAVDKILTAYKKILEIKKLKLELKNHGLTAKNLKGIEQYANKLMEKEIKALIPKIMKNYNVIKEPNRKNELNNLLRIILNKIANRIE